MNKQVERRWVRNNNTRNKIYKITIQNMWYELNMINKTTGEACVQVTLCRNTEDGTLYKIYFSTILLPNPLSPYVPTLCIIRPFWPLIFISSIWLPSVVYNAPYIQCTWALLTSTCGFIYWQICLEKCIQGSGGETYKKHSTWKIRIIWEVNIEMGLKNKMDNALDLFDSK